MRLILAPALASLAFAAGGQASDGQGVQLAAALKKPISAAYKGYLFTKVACSIPSPTAAKARCNAFFTHKTQELKGVFRIAVTIDRSTGGVRWKATSASCTDLRTGATVRC